MVTVGVSALVDLAKTVIRKGGEAKLNTANCQISGIISRLFRYQSPKESEIIDFEVPGRAEMLSFIRARVAEFASSMPFTIDEIYDIKLAVGEASTNAIKYGANSEWCNIVIRLEKRKDALMIRITDKGCGFNPEILCRSAVDNCSECGRGIIFMRALMDEVKFHSGSGGTTVEMIKRYH